MNLSCGWHPTELIKIGKTSVDAVELGYIVPSVTGCLKHA